MDGDVKPTPSSGYDRDESLAQIEQLTLASSVSVAEKAADNVGASRGGDGEQETTKVSSQSSEEQRENGREVANMLDSRCVSGSVYVKLKCVVTRNSVQYVVLQYRLTESV